MTRKQAILSAINILSTNQENQEICDVLNELLNELPLSHWTEKSILDAINQFLIENDRLPSSKDYLKTDYLPNRITIKNKLGLTMEEFYNKYYGNFYYNNNSIYNYKDINYWANIFKEQYNKHNKPCLYEFDKQRDIGTPCVQTYLKIIGINTWNELLKYCGLCSNKNSQREKVNYSVICNFSQNSSAEKINNINISIEKIILNNQH